MIPKLEDIRLPVPQFFPAGEAYNPLMANSEEDETLSDIAWQNFFQDEELKRLIAIGLENNRDLRTATLNITEARALYGIERSDLLPSISADGSYTRQDSSDDVNNLTSAPEDIYAVGLGIPSYEIDLFGRIQSLSRAALNNYFATEAARQAVKTSLIAEIANGYVNFMASQSQLALAIQTVETQQEAFDLIDERVAAGISNALQLRQAEILLQQAKADQYRFLLAATEAENALRLLLGSPDNLSLAYLPDADDLSDLEKFDSLVSSVPVGLPSDLLINRPDIIAAEYQLKSANANIGAARAAFFPSISLTGSAGYRSDELSGLFESRAGFWQFSPQVTIPLFTGGRLRNTLNVAEIRKEKAIVAYEQAIETAFREVSDSLAAVSTFDDRIKAQTALIDATQQATEISQLRFDSGIENYLTVLDAERELYAARQNYISQLAQNTAAKINLYRALGGGR